MYMISDFHSSGIKRLPTYSGAIGAMALKLDAMKASRNDLKQAIGKSRRRQTVRRRRPVLSIFPTKAGQVC
jgi:hypothetical protein